MKRLTVKDLLDLPNASETRREVFIPELGSVVIRGFSLNQHRAMLKECSQGDDFDWPRWHALLLQNGIADPEMTYDEAAQLCEKHFGIVNGLIDAIMQLSHITSNGTISEKAVQSTEESFRQ